MSQQGPILVVSNAGRPAFASVLDEAGMFPVVDAGWADASRAIDQVQPAAVVAAATGAVEPRFAALAKQVAAQNPYLPLVAVDPKGRLPENAIPFSQNDGNFGRLVARLNATLRMRTLHATVMRRQDEDRLDPIPLADTNAARDATVLLIGRGAAYPALSVSLGQRMGVVGALSIEAAAKHLNTRDIDGIVLGEGFTARVMDAFLTVLSEDSRFRNLPVVLTSQHLAPDYDLPNLEIISGEPALVAANALPLIRQHAFEAHLSRALRSIDAGGLLDPRCGLLTSDAFNRDFATAVYQTSSRGGGLSVARFAFDPSHERAQIDGARIISRLMRQMDFGAIQHDGSVIVVFAETDLRNAHMIARRLSSVMHHTSHGTREVRPDPSVTVTAMMPNDSAKALLARLYGEARRAVS
jgi:hypothetical protein